MIIRPRVWLQLRVKRMMVPWTAILAQAPCGKVKRWGASVHVVVSFQLFTLCTDPLIMSVSHLVPYSMATCIFSNLTVFLVLI